MEHSCHAGGIYAVVETADASNCIDPSGMTKLYFYSFLCLPGEAGRYELIKLDDAK